MFVHFDKYPSILRYIKVETSKILCGLDVITEIEIHCLWKAFVVVRKGEFI